MPLSTALRAAEVSRTAYYSLARKDSILPKSVGRLARVLGVSPAAFLTDEATAVARLRELQTQAEALHRRHPGADRDVMFRTLQNLDLPPLQRLRRALVRAPRTRLHQGSHGVAGASGRRPRALPRTGVVPTSDAAAGELGAR